MSRLLALVVVAVIAFACAPRPVTVVPVEQSVEVESTGTPEFLYLLPEPEDSGLDRIDDPVSEFDRLDLRTWTEMITTDHLGPPLAPDPEEFREPKVLISGHGPRRSPRWRLFRENGGNSESERALALGLWWLARQQKVDGGWEFERGEKNDRVVITGLALLPYLAAGETHKPKLESEQKYQKTVAAGVGFLLRNCQYSGPRTGRFENTTMTGQAIATLVLCEAYTATRDPILKPYARAAIHFFQNSQVKSGGWCDTSDDASDVIVVAWVVRALHSGRKAKDLDVDEDIVKKAIQFLDRMSAGEHKSMYGLTDNSAAKPGTTATAAGLLCRHNFAAWGPNHPGMIDGVAGLMKNPPSEANRDPAYLYFATQVLWWYGGDKWKDWNLGPEQADGTRTGGVRDVLVRSQLRTDGKKLGSWDASGEFGIRYGRVGTTALNVLTLAVYFREPVDKRGAGPEK